MLLPTALGLLASWDWVRRHPQIAPPVIQPPAFEETPLLETDRLPPDADEKRVLAAAVGGNIEAAKDHLLQRLSTAPYDDLPGMLAAVVAQDPGWLEIYLDRYLASKPNGYPADQWENSVQGIVEHLMGALWRSDPEAFWKAAELSPRLRANLSSLSSYGPTTLLNRENALRVLDPAFEFGDELIRYLCGSLPDAEVLSRILAMVKQGRFDGKLPKESIATLLKMRAQAPELYRTLEAQLTPEMKDALADAWNPADPTVSAAPQDPARARPPSADRINDILTQTGQFVPLSDVVALFPDSDGEAAAGKTSQTDYFNGHLPQIDRDMRQLIAAPGDREKLEAFADTFFDACETYQDPAQLMEWREALNEDERDGLFDFYAKKDAAGALKYAQEKMPPGPERDALIEAATEQMP